MKRILFAAAALATIGFNTSAFAAADATATVTMGGAVVPTCTLGAPVQSAETNATTTPGALTSSVALTLANASTAALNAGGFTLTYAGMCNYAHSVGIKATNGGLLQATPVTPVGGTFVQRIGYTASIGWAGANVAVPGGAMTSTAAATGLVAAQTANNAAVAGFNKGDLVLTVAVGSGANASTDPVVAGTYSETLTLQIGATL